MILTALPGPCELLPGRTLVVALEAKLSLIAIIHKACG